MNQETRETIHMGVNFVFVPMPIINKQTGLAFQQQLISHGVDFARAEYGERDITISGELPTHLGVKLIAGGPPPHGQLLILSPQSGNNPDLFGQQIDAVVSAFEATWPEPGRQLLSCDVTMRDLYDTSAEHAFKELWEVCLGQSPETLVRLGRPVLGGGLRFVMPPNSPDDHFTIDAKIESFLQDTRRLFVEIQLAWPQVESPGTPFAGAHRLKCADDYMQRQLIPFICGGSDDQPG